MKLAQTSGEEHQLLAIEEASASQEIWLTVEAGDDGDYLVVWSCGCAAISVLRVVRTQGESVTSSRRGDGSRRY